VLAHRLSKLCRQGEHAQHCAYSNNYRSDQADPSGGSLDPIRHDESFGGLKQIASPRFASAGFASAGLASARVALVRVTSARVAFTQAILSCAQFSHGHTLGFER